MPDWGALVGDMTALQLILWVAAAVFLIGVLVKGWPLIRNSVRIADALLRLPKLAEDFAQLTAQVKDIHHETHKNDGSSLKDAVGRIETSVEGLHGRLDTVEKDMGGLRDVDTSHAAKLDRHLTDTADLIEYVRKEKEKDQ